MIGNKVSRIYGQPQTYMHPEKEPKASLKFHPYLFLTSHHLMFNGQPHFT